MYTGSNPNPYIFHLGFYQVSNWDGNEREERELLQRAHQNTIKSSARPQTNHIFAHSHIKSRQGLGEPRFHPTQRMGNGQTYQCSEGGTREEQVIVRQILQETSIH